MDRKIRIILLSGSGLLITFGLAMLASLSTIRVEAAQNAWRTKPRESDKKARRKPSEPSTDDVAKRREAIHRLMLDGKYQHDGAGELLEIGDLTSVPSLLRVLKDYPPTRGVNGRLTFICTAAHALVALRKVTGIDAGATYEEWSEWWEQNKKYHERK